MKLIRITHENCERKKTFDFFHFYFSDTYSSLSIQSNCEKFYPCLHNILLEGRVSQNFDLCLSFYFRLYNVKNSGNKYLKRFYIR